MIVPEDMREALGPPRALVLPDLMCTLGLSAFVRMFELLDICSEVVADYGLLEIREFPFTACAPPSAMVPLDSRIYRAHVKELCERWLARKRDTDLNYLTGAEVLVAMRDASLAAPLTRTGAAIYARLFGDIMPGACPEVEELDRERWRGEVDEELQRLKQKPVARPRALA